MAPRFGCDLITERELATSQVNTAFDAVGYVLLVGLCLDLLRLLQGSSSFCADIRASWANTGTVMSEAQGSATGISTS